MHSLSEIFLLIQHELSADMGFYMFHYRLNSSRGLK